MRIAVVGLGLIGGSLARDLSAAGHTVVGYDRDARTLRAVRRAHVISEVLPADLDGIESCDACVIALPVDATVALLRDRAAKLSRVPVVTDVGSTKASIVRAATAAGLARRFVGGHPLAGDHRSGWRAARRGLFAKQRVYLTPTSASSNSAIRAARRLWRSVGATVIESEAAAHDRLLAATSHLPQVTATALATLLADRGIPRSAMGRGGRDATRLAASSAAVWAPILTDNRQNVGPAIRAFMRTLTALARALDRGDRRALGVVLRRSEAWAVSTTGRPL